jgi:synaptic vesicle membrane protein VAT-1
LRQVWIPKYGPPQVLEIREAPPPIPNAGEVRIRVAYSGVNFADVMARLGVYPDAPPPPMVVGYEVSGTVDILGDGVPTEWEGAQVVGLTRFNGYSEYLCLPLVQVNRVPDGVSLETAAALPVNALTAYQMLIGMGRVNPGDKVLVHGAGGGVGWIAVQMAQILGATVYGTASASKHAALKEIGVSAVIDYHRADFVKAIRELTDGAGVEVILDPIGGHHWMRSYKALAPTGRLVMFGAAGVATGTRRNLFSVIRWGLTVPWLVFNPLRLISDNKGLIGVNLGHLWDEIPRMRPWMDQIIEWHQDGKLSPRIDQIFPFEEAAAAHERLQKRENIGKLLLRP